MRTRLLAALLMLGIVQGPGWGLEMRLEGLEKLKTQVQVGEELEGVVTVRWDPGEEGIEVGPLDIPKRDSLVFVSGRTSVKSLEGGGQSAEHHLRFKAVSPGEVELGPFRASTQNPSANEKGELSTGSLFISVIQPPNKGSLDRSILIKGGLLGGLILAAGCLGFVWRRARRQPGSRPGERFQDPMDERFLAVRRKRIDGDWPGYAQELESILRDRLGALSEEARQEALSDHATVLSEIQNAIQRVKFAGYCPSAEEADVIGQKVEQMSRQIRDRRPRGG